MTQANDPYTSAAAWREVAMSRPQTVTQAESSARLQAAELHNRQNGTTDPDTLLDQQLYILGKMDISEYQSYLLFKHATPG